LDALFVMLSQRYDVLIVDLPAHWFDWTPQILSASNLAFVTGLNTVPGLRQVAESVKAVQGLDNPPAEVAVVLNRCKRRLIGGVVGQRFVKRVLAAQTVFYVREDPAAAKQSANTGVPVSLGTPLSRISKDVAKLGSLTCARRAAAVALE
jgi:Flp pilus assembly CpaE family ATPase